MINDFGNLSREVSCVNILKLGLVLIRFVLDLIILGC